MTSKHLMLRETQPLRASGRACERVHANGSKRNRGRVRDLTQALDQRPFEKNYTSSQVQGLHNGALDFKPQSGKGLCSIRSPCTSPLFTRRLNEVREKLPAEILPAPLHQPPAARCAKVKFCDVLDFSLSLDRTERC